jgi:hypothetical protein
MILTFNRAYGSTIDLHRDGEIQGYEFLEPPVEYRFLRGLPDLGLDFTSAWFYLPFAAGNYQCRCPDARSGCKESRNRNAGPRWNLRFACLATSIADLSNDPSNSSKQNQFSNREGFAAELKHLLVYVVMWP